MESDINGADQALNVALYDGAVLQPFLSEQAGRPIYHDVVFIRIQVPGDKNSVVDRPIEEMDKRRFPLHWAHYTNNAKDMTEIGTPLSEVPGITKGAVLTLKATGFSTVEQFAAASDQVLQGLGMSAGVSPLAFREKCKQFMGATADMAPAAQLESALAQRDAQIAALQAQVAQLIAMQAPALSVALSADTPEQMAQLILAEKSPEDIAPASKPKLGLNSLKQSEAA